MRHYVIYNSPDDYPGLFVVRRWDVGDGQILAMEHTTHETLDEARASIPQGLVCFDRSEEDELCIVETWL